MLTASGFKCFLIHSGVDEFPAVTKAEVLEALMELKNTDAVLLFHAECEVEKEQEQESDPDLYSTFLESRPPGTILKHYLQGLGGHHYIHVCCKYANIFSCESNSRNSRSWSESKSVATKSRNFYHY